jgi:hypothetical protein
MIVRASMQVRFAGRKREREATGFAEGLARLVVTGAFYRWSETERVTGTEVRGAVGRALAAAGLTAGAGGEVPGALSGGGEADGRPVAVRGAVRERHPRGRAGLVVDVVMVVGGVSEGAEMSDRLLRAAQAAMRDRGRCERQLAEAVAAMERLVAQVEAGLRGELPVESVSVELERGVAAGWAPERLEGLPAAAAAWVLASAQVAAAAGAWLEVVPPDGGGSFDAGPMPDGGGHFDAGSGDVGGGSFGA